MIGDFQSRHPGSKLETRNQKLEIGKERTGANRKLEVRNWKRREKTEKPQVEKRNLGHPGEPGGRPRGAVVSGPPRRAREWRERPMSTTCRNVHSDRDRLMTSQDSSLRSE